MHGNEGRVYKFGEFRLDANEHTLHRGEELVAISPRTFDLLLKLVENPGRLLQKETLMQEVWAGSVVEEGNLNRTMSNLRKILGEKPKEDRYIQTVPRVGYRFIAPVEVVSATAATESPVAPASAPDTLPPTAVSPARLNRGSSWIVPALAVALLVVLVGGVITWQRRSSIAAPKPAAPVREPVRLTNNPGDDSHPRWTQDGRIRFFGADANNQTKSFIMNADGSAQAAVNDFANLKTGVWSPDGQKVVFQKPNDNHASYLANADGSNEIALPFIRGNFDWSFDSKEIVYQRTIDENNAEVFIYSLGTKKSRNLTNHPGFDGDPSFSPDNKQVVFVSNRNGNNDLHLLNVDGTGEPVRLTSNPADDSHPVFSPDGTAIAFTSDRKNESADAYLLLTLSGNEVVLPLTDWLSNETVEPGCWSPDGTTIAFHSDRNGKDDIYTVNAEVLKAQLVIADPQKNLGFPSYSPDGRYLLFQAELEDKSTELSIYDTTTNQTRVLRKSAFGDAAPVWSPDGEWIAFQSRLETNTEICVIKPDGSGFRNLTNHPARDLSPTWSPDGKQIAFTSNRGPSTQVFQLFLMNADGTDQRQYYSSSGSVSTPSWSPNGGIYFADDKDENRTGNFEIFSLTEGSNEPAKRLTFRKRFDMSPVSAPRTKSLVFVSELDGNSEIYWMYFTGTALVRLTRSATTDISPHWSPDGGRIIFSSNRSGKFALYEISLNDFAR